LNIITEPCTRRMIDDVLPDSSPYSWQTILRRNFTPPKHRNLTMSHHVFWSDARHSFVQMVSSSEMDSIVIYHRHHYSQPHDLCLTVKGRLRKVGRDVVKPLFTSSDGMQYAPPRLGDSNVRWQ
jgi:hypothetical protein